MTTKDFFLLKIAALNGAGLLKTLAKSVNMGPQSASAALVRGGQSATAMDTYQPFMQAMTTGLPGGAQGNWRHLVGMAREVANRPGGASSNPEFAANFAKMWNVRKKSLQARAANPNAQSGMQSVAPTMRPAAPTVPQPAPRLQQPAKPVNRLQSMQPETIRM